MRELERFGRSREIAESFREKRTRLPISRRFRDREGSRASV